MTIVTRLNADLGYAKGGGMKLLRGLLIIVVVLVSAILAPILWQRAASPARFRPIGKRLADYLAS